MCNVYKYLYLCSKRSYCCSLVLSISNFEIGVTIVIIELNIKLSNFFQSIWKSKLQYSCPVNWKAFYHFAMLLQNSKIVFLLIGDLVKFFVKSTYTCFLDCFFTFLFYLLSSSGFPSLLESIWATFITIEISSFASI